MTEEIKYNKDEKWVPYKQLAETPQQTIARLEQENKELKNKNICKETCEYFKRICNENTLLIKYRSALEEIKNDIMTKEAVCTNCIKIAKRIDEVLE